MNSPRNTDSGFEPDAPLVYLTDWAISRGLNPDTVRIQWPSRSGFPDHVDTHSETGRGRKRKRYDPEKLDEWLRVWREKTTFAMPEGAEEFRTLYAIAKLLKVDSKTVTQYREKIEKVSQWRQGATPVYRTRDVVDYLNNVRPNVHGLALDPTQDRRRKTNRPS